MKKPSTAQQNIRIIGGEWRSRKISFPSVEGLRPTGDRTRETLFNWLTPYISSSHCLDLFAGSGALGLEALSRGAPSVNFIETNKLAFTALADALKLLKVENAQLHHMPAEKFLTTHSLQNIDVIFLDPPYRLYRPRDLFKLVEDQLPENHHCQIFYEHDTHVTEADLPTHWKIKKQKKAGSVFYYLLERKN